MTSSEASASGSFPSNDWALVANDEENGGASHFSIEDVTADTRPFSVAAGVTSGRLHVDYYGVGFGTTTPGTEIQVVDGNTPTLRLEQDG